MHGPLNLVLALGTQQSGSNWVAVAGWIVGIVGIIFGLIGASIGATSYLRGQRRDRGYSEVLRRLEQQWRDYYTDEQVRALVAEQGRLLDQIRAQVPEQARYIFLQDQRQSLSNTIGELYRQYDDITRRLAADGYNAGEGLRPELVDAIAQDIVPAYVERQRREFWVSLSVTALLVMASVLLALPLLLPLAPLLGMSPPGGTRWAVAQAYDYFLVCGIVYLILRVAPWRRRTPDHTAERGVLLRFALPYVVLPALWFAVTAQFFLPYLMAVMGGVPLDSLLSGGEAWRHAGLGLASAVLTAILLRVLPWLRHKKDADMPQAGDQPTIFERDDE